MVTSYQKIPAELVVLVSFSLFQDILHLKCLVSNAPSFCKGVEGVSDPEFLLHFFFCFDVPDQAVGKGFVSLLSISFCRRSSNFGLLTLVRTFLFSAIKEGNAKLK